MRILGTEPGEEEERAGVVFDGMKRCIFPSSFRTLPLDRAHGLDGIWRL